MVSCYSFIWTFMFFFFFLYSKTFTFWFLIYLTSSTVHCLWFLPFLLLHFCFLFGTSFLEFPTPSDVQMSTPFLFFAFLLLFFPLSLSFYLPDSNPLLSFSDQVRERHLYTANKRQGLFLEMTSDGMVRGNPVQTANSVMELRSVTAGETVIRGVSSSLYLCADETGQLRGQKIYTEADCTFNELLLEDGYTLFLSVRHRLPVSLTKKRSLENRVPPFSQFLPVQNQLFSAQGREENKGQSKTPNTEYLDLNSDDPFGIELKDLVLSPEFNANFPHSP
ncbi:fibroblast growth factor 21 [Scleropages formosus]|uniref:Fibroblast growth factor n=1 Tax=Scleropages formosus TaxID=113540 RepID=A0A8C9RXS7_SCLFO|nr:fibroblast growth factor 21-like [Scleropages formosus]